MAAQAAPSEFWQETQEKVLQAVSNAEELLGCLGNPPGEDRARDIIACAGAIRADLLPHSQTWAARLGLQETLKEVVQEYEASWTAPTNYLELCQHAHEILRDILMDFDIDGGEDVVRATLADLFKVGVAMDYILTDMGYVSGSSVATTTPPTTRSPDVGGENLQEEVRSPDVGGNSSSSTATLPGSHTGNADTPPDVGGGTLLDQVVLFLPKTGKVLQEVQGATDTELKEILRLEGMLCPAVRAATVDKAAEGAAKEFLDYCDNQLKSCILAGSSIHKAIQELRAEVLNEADESSDEPGESAGGVPGLANTTVMDAGDSHQHSEGVDAGELRQRLEGVDAGELRQRLEVAALQALREDDGD